MVLCISHLYLLRLALDIWGRGGWGLPFERSGEGPPIGTVSLCPYLFWTLQWGLQRVKWLIPLWPKGKFLVQAYNGPERACGEGTCMLEVSWVGKSAGLVWQQTGWGWLQAWSNGWERPVLCYHKTMVIYPYPFLVVINQILSWTIFNNDCICILTGSPENIFMIVYVIWKIGDNKNDPNSINAKVNCHDHGENRVITQ